jgi:hypothetical protein
MESDRTYEATQGALLRRRRLVYVEGDRGEPTPDNQLQSLEVEWAVLGFVPSERLRAKLRRVRGPELAAVRDRVCGVLARMRGADRKHEPLFRSFPDGIPDDTFDLWITKVLSHWFQTDVEQPCLFCRAVGSTHVLDPCLHVVCDRCFDGASYSACPICEHHVDRSSPFFKPSPERVPSEKETVKLQLLDLGEDLEADTRALFTSFCERKQAMSPSDRSDLEGVVLDAGERVFAWLPEKIPVKENVAVVFGTLFRVVDPAVVLPVAARYLKTATDVLRFLAVFSGADASLIPQATYVMLEAEVQAQPRWLAQLAKLDGQKQLYRHHQRVYVPIEKCRFKMARLSRPLRKALLALLEGFGADSLAEDMLRNRSFWVWAGEFLHPHEYAKRFPKVARAFAIVRKFAPDGTPAPEFTGFYGRLEAAAAAGDASAMLGVLEARPGELARRFDHLLRVAGDDQPRQAAVTAAFVEKAPRVSTPVLLTLYRHLPGRYQAAARRVYWPKGTTTSGYSAPDRRAQLSPLAIDRAVEAVGAELLRRYGEKPALDDMLIDAALSRIMVPFNERTASRGAVSLPRGSVVPVPADKMVRMFLHWCQPEKGGYQTDIDLSIGFYTDSWKEAGTCSYYNLKLIDRHKRVIATSGGDLRDAPFPDGATELIDLDRARAREAGIRWAVMVVNAYGGMPFSLLERGFAGLMLRDDTRGAYFDPRTVELKFDLQGEHGVFMPLVLDLREGVLHWLDVYSEGQLIMNNVATSRRAITNICPTLIDYFASGVRATMYELALLHGAARARRVYVRSEPGAGGPPARCFERGPDEDPAAFLSRLSRGEGGEASRVPVFPDGGSALAVLYRGDIDLPTETPRYVLFPAKLAGTLSASDLI